MPHNKFAKDALFLLHSDQKLLEILNASNEYLEQHSNVREKINDCTWVLRSLCDLMPITAENLCSGHIFPISEAEYELESSTVFCKLGFYKHAIASLRSLLELGLLSVYWDVEDKSHIDIQGWLKSRESTPFRKAIFNRLQTHPNIKTYDERQKIFAKTAKLYEELSNFSHTLGRRYSSLTLNPHSNVNTFTETSFLRWLQLMERVIEVVAMFHVLKYPVGLQETPLGNKFGLNGPMGGFLDLHQVDRIKRIISQDLLADLQDISNHDPNAVSMAAWVNGKPDITPEEFAAQIEKQDQKSIQGRSPHPPISAGLHPSPDRNAPP